MHLYTYYGHENAGRVRQSSLLQDHVDRTKGDGHSLHRLITILFGHLAADR